jgi:membrane-bound metal-dependent hydrolase YbcI (DUF457 family)
MPSPVGHALAAVTCGWIAAPPARERRALVVQIAVLAMLGVAPDLDLLIDRHRAEMHSIGAAMIVATLAALMNWPVATSRWRIWLAATLAWGSHPLLDALGADSKAPFGSMAFWPFSHRYFIAPWALFLPITRRWNSAMFLVANGKALLVELACLVPVALLAWWVRRR